MQCFYPRFAQWLIDQKSKEIDYYKQEVGENYKPYKNVCIDAQRIESRWARQVWRELTSCYKYVFLPVHDSVLLFATDKACADDVDMMIDDTVNVMRHYMEDATGGQLSPVFHVKKMNVEKISTEQ